MKPKDAVIKSSIKVKSLLAKVLFLGSVMVQLSISHVQAEEQLTQSGLLVSVSPENISINLEGGATSINISGNTTTVAIAAPVATPSTHVPAASPSAPQAQEKNSNKSGLHIPSWSTLSDLVKTSGIFGGAFTLISVSFYLLYKNRHHFLLSKITTMTTSSFHAIKNLW